MPTQICAAVEGGGKDACAGDSGGPYLDLHKSFKQVGVTSFGTGCGRTGTLFELGS